MSKQNETLLYKAFGLTITSAYKLPELKKVPSNSTPDVYIIKSDLSQQWNELAAPNRYFYADNRQCMFIVPGVAIFKVENGNTITVSPCQSSYDNQIRLYILGTAMGALLLQRKILPIHASVISINGEAYAVVGDSGAGKSTLASAFLKRGYSLLSDDLIAVTLNEENIPIVTPSYPQQKLWQESLDQFGLESTNFHPIIERETKFVIPVKEQFVSTPLPLKGMIELTKKESGYPEIKPVQNLARLHKLFVHTFRNFLIARSGLMNWHFETTVTIANKIDFYQIVRPANQFTAYELADMILAKYQKEETIV